MGEFELIRHYFHRPVRRATLGVGDDCALLRVADGCQLAVSSDMLVCGRHFFADVDPEALGHKALAVNLSDLAACGARPLAFTLALALPTADEAWLAGFSRGLLARADDHGCELIGGDTTRGPLNICITVFGEVPSVGASTTALLRSGASAGDDLWVSGNLGDARLALDALRGSHPLPPEVLAMARQRLERPMPRVALGLALRSIATAAIDVSDGLLGDLAHVMEASRLGASIEVAAARACLAASWAGAPDLDEGHALNCVLAGGDDYELAFTAPPDRRFAVMSAAEASGTPVTRIGRMEAEPGLRLMTATGQMPAPNLASYDHFA